jgi:predicted ATPase
MRGSFDSLVEWTKLVFPRLKDLVVSPDHHTGKFVVRAVIDEDYQLRVPLQSLSDGTVKWLSVASAIVANKDSFSIEEPENFLHPTMQQFFLQIARDAILDAPGSGNAIISTHSETIINACKPSEIIIFDFRSGRTTCRRIKNIDKIQSEINRTGFGLGYYYASNTLS